MSSGPRKARCKKCGAVFKEDGSTTLKNHRNKSCPALKATSGSSQRTMGIDGSLWLCEAARVWERMAHFVIQETLPFDYFDNKRMTSLIQKTFQPRYCHTIENVVENESHFSLDVVNQDLSSLAMFTKHLMGEQRKRVVRSQWRKRVGKGKVESMGGIGGGSFAKRSMVAKDGLGVMDRCDVEDHQHIKSGVIVVEWLLEKLVGLPMCSLKVERMVDREKKKFLD
ncbi:hypothetical protein Tco_0730143 [Tanacetum coccineum]|uniref:BED-type domain-containing protein n=1 Tax=Tanacetum coccineum TaxID=301880 RepID=A0ABQ4YTQ7_9ASTR